MCPESQAIYPIDVVAGKPEKPIRFPSQPTGMRVHPDGTTAVVLSANAGHIHRVNLMDRTIQAHVSLPGLASSFDVSGDALAVGIPSQHSVLHLNSQTLATTATSHVGVEPRTIRFRGDGKTVLMGAWQERQIVTLDPTSGRVLTRLPVPISPERFCFNADGGQLFVSGSGGDVVTIVNPYQNEVAETILAGRTPGSMAATDRANGQAALLLVANQDSGDLTIIDIDTRMLAASVHVGEQPGSVLVTPNFEYALVLNRQSGNMAVIRLATVLNHKNKTKPLFTVVPVGADPISAQILPREA